MNYESLKKRARSYARDLNNNTFRDIDVLDYMNEAIERCGQEIPQLRGMNELQENLDVVTLMPKVYQHILAIYCAARLFAQDERFHQSATLMNEFEVKLSQLANEVLSGEIVIVDSDGNEVEWTAPEDHVKNVYFTYGSASDEDIDEGVDEVEGPEVVYDGGTF
jgi:hypothetical protein